jgi:hypothetical protein
MDLTTQMTAVKAAFEAQVVTISLDRIQTPRPPTASAMTSRKFLQILASIATIGLVEPLVVTRIQPAGETYRLLDGRLRYNALQRLNIPDAACLISTDDEAYTYNKHINRLTPAQDARMISKAIDQGVSSERIANVLGLDTNTVRRRATLLTGICPEAAELLAEKVCPATTFSILKQMKPLRQLEAAELMCGQGNYSSAFVRAILAATPENQLELRPPSTRKTDAELTAQLTKLEKELAALQANATLTDERYGVDQLHLTVAIGYVSTLMNNAAVVLWLEQHYLQFANYFQQLKEEADEIVESRRQPRLPFRRPRARPTLVSKP